LEDRDCAGRSDKSEGQGLSFLADPSGLSLGDLVHLLANRSHAEHVEGGDDALRAIGWATVDLERTASGVPALQFGDAGEEPVLGARALRARVGSIDLLLLEPSTEGRLAGWLARYGEGVVVLYVERSTTDAHMTGQATALGRVGRLEVSGVRARPYLIIVEPA
jgi:hypothetical protein